MKTSHSAKHYIYFFFLLMEICGVTIGKIDNA